MQVLPKNFEEIKLQCLADIRSVTEMEDVLPSLGAPDGYCSCLV